MIKTCDNPCMVVFGDMKSASHEQKALFHRLSLQPGSPIMLHTTDHAVISYENHKPNEPILYQFNRYESLVSKAFFTMAYYKICTTLLWKKIYITPYAYYYPNGTMGEIKVHIKNLLLSYDTNSNTFKYLDGTEPTAHELSQEAIESYRPPSVIFDAIAVPELSVAYTYGMCLLREIYTTLNNLGVQNITPPDSLIRTRKNPEYTSFTYGNYHFLYHRETSTINFFDKKTDCLLDLNRATIRRVFASLPTFIANNNLLAWILHRQVALRVHAILRTPLAHNISITWDEPYIKIMRNNQQCWYDLVTKHFMNKNQCTKKLEEMKMSDIRRLVTCQHK